MLVYLLKWHLKSETQQTIIFGATRYIVEYVAHVLSEVGYECDHIYGAMDAAARKIALARFRNGRVRFLAVTDVAARGLDVPLLDNVVNFDVSESYAVLCLLMSRLCCSCLRRARILYIAWVVWRALDAPAQRSLWLPATTYYLFF